MSDLIIKLADYQEDFPKSEEIRRIVFQEGQGVDSDLDFDGDDEISEQLIAYLNDEVVGTARIRYLNAQTAKIERLAVLPIARGQGFGKKIMEKALLVIASKNIPEVVIHAQEYVKGLHQQLGFQEEGEVFEEAGIRHVKMKKYLNC
ncbi:GNAT family N-acetyltransferase [Chlorogloeopsis sp. ULAP01]|uniref:GNAT family N-acetyltransferase n=1 Tax=Chlorogloeopsis sp. ULAP01 TaxID=3056483 RepID=UPI0025AAD975|nr:GNAT family N-acetyltransferase [Chlorogloeopsis sp. ULAP01]MDM9380590.1 GNAT family N-acetyltransferase [Chlorogloeopsis sp. ULAP01]